MEAFLDLIEGEVFGTGGGKQPVAEGAQHKPVSAAAEVILDGGQRLCSSGDGFGPGGMALRQARVIENRVPP
jgi:hypothetical protein